MSPNHKAATAARPTLQQLQLFLLLRGIREGGGGCVVSPAGSLLPISQVAGTQQPVP